MSKKILILDDETQYIEALQKFLQEFGYAVCITISSKQALEVIRNDRPDLVLFDYKSFDMHGDTFLEEAKKINSTIPYILVTAWNDPVVLDRFKKLGVTNVFMKPVKLEALFNKIKEILKKKEIKTQ